jgi:hypothetical protein
MKKNKWNIIGKELDIESEKYKNDFYWFWYDGDDYDKFDYNHSCDNCGSTYCHDYEYCQEYRYLNGNYIDMMSIYSKEYLRQKKIDYLLGVDKYEVYKKPTIGDIYESRNI